MIKSFSDYLGVSDKEFSRLDILNAYIGIDTHFFLDPLLLKDTSIPEFSKSRQKIETYFENVVRVLCNSTHSYDFAWKEARKMLIFPEVRGVSIGYGVSSSDGRGIGIKLATELVEQAKELIKLGIKDPVIFELIGLFIDGFGPDSLSDMAIKILIDDIFAYSQRMYQQMGVKSLRTYSTQSASYNLAPRYDGKPLILMPKGLLKDLPVAQSWEDIENIVSYNAILRKRLNALLASALERATVGYKKEIMKTKLFTDAESLKELITDYKKFNPKAYDFAIDPVGELKWYNIAQAFCKSSPLQIPWTPTPTIGDLEVVIEKIVNQFKKNIEFNGLNIALYDHSVKPPEPLHERFSQTLFFATADNYCDANNIDLTRECNAGRGPVDFKFSKGYSLRYLIDVKLSSNKHLVQGFEEQLPTYQKAESTEHSAMLIIRVTKSDKSIKKILKLQHDAIAAGKRVPRIFIIDGLLKPSASHKQLNP